MFTQQHQQQFRPEIARVAEQVVTNLKTLEGRIELLKQDLASLCTVVGHPEAARIAVTPVQQLTGGLQGIPTGIQGFGPQGISPYTQGFTPQGIQGFTPQGIQGFTPQGIQGSPFAQGFTPQGINPYTQGFGSQGISPYTQGFGMPGMPSVGGTPGWGTQGISPYTQGFGVNPWLNYR